MVLFSTSPVMRRQTKSFSRCVFASELCEPRGARKKKWRPVFGRDHAYKEGRRSADRRTVHVRAAQTSVRELAQLICCAAARTLGALAFRRSAAALARANASAIGSAPVPAFPETRPGGRYPFRPVTSLPRSAETGRYAGRAVAQSRPGAERIFSARRRRTRSVFRKCPRERLPSLSEIFL